MIPDYLRNTAAPPPTGDDVARQILWLRSHLRPFAIFCAMMEISGEAPASEIQGDLFIAAINTAEDLGWTNEVGSAAATAELASSLETVRATADRVIAAVRPRVARQETGDEIFAAAKAADPGAFIPTPVLIDFCARIAQARMPRRVRA